MRNKRFRAILLYVSTIAFQVKTASFEGSLELLLDLIERRKLHVSDVSLAVVADDYIKHIETLEAFPVGDTAQFILVASTLLLIKSKALLPTLELSAEEEADIHELERRLELYRRVRKLSRRVSERFGANILFPREDGGYTEPVFAPDPSLSLASLHGAARTLIRHFPKPAQLTNVMVDTVVSLEEMIENLTERIKKNITIRFKDFSHNGSGGREEKLNVVISFLAMLELVKRGIIAVRQSGHFDEIEMETQDITTPNYA